MQVKLDTRLLCTPLGSMRPDVSRCLDESDLGDRWLRLVEVFGFAATTAITHISASLAPRCLRRANPIYANIEGGPAPY